MGLSLYPWVQCNFVIECSFRNNFIPLRLESHHCRLSFDEEDISFLVVCVLKISDKKKRKVVIAMSCKPNWILSVGTVNLPKMNLNAFKLAVHIFWHKNLFQIFLSDFFIVLYWILSEHRCTFLHGQKMLWGGYGNIVSRVQNGFDKNDDDVKR